VSSPLLTKTWARPTFSNNQPGVVSLTMIDDWCTDVLLDKGVWGKDPNSGNPIRLPTCQYDLVNMDWSAEAVLNSCTPALRYDLETKVPIEDHKGPKLGQHEKLWPFQTTGKEGYTHRLLGVIRHC
jgi:hypothetical protein